jgi:hypothetical protein
VGQTTAAAEGTLLHISAIQQSEEHKNKRAFEGTLLKVYKVRAAQWKWKLSFSNDKI